MRYTMSSLRNVKAACMVDGKALSKYVCCLTVGKENVINEGKQILRVED